MVVLKLTDKTNDVKKHAEDNME